MIVLQRPQGARLFFMLHGSILPRVAAAVSGCVLVAVLVTLCGGTLFHGKVTLTTAPFSIIGLALAICLGFRNNVAYDRWWEARRLWGDIVHRSRCLARQLQGLTAHAEPAIASDAGDPRTAMVRRTVAFAHALRHQLRGSDPIVDVLPWLPRDEHAGFEQARRRTEHLLRATGRDLGRLVREGALDARLAAEVDLTLSALSAAAAGCERIRATPMPFAYTLLLHRTATLFCVLLPFGLVDTIGLMTPFVVAIVAYTFFGLDAVGNEIEEPFALRVHHVPLSALCRTIEIDLLEALGEADLPAPLEPVGYRLD